MRYLIPLVLFLVLVVFLAIGLTRDPQELPSALINKPAPAFRLPQLIEPDKTFAAEDMRGKVWILNVWASWCFECRREHPYLSQYSKSTGVPIVGLNYKDKRRRGKKDLRLPTRGTNVRRSRHLRWFAVAYRSV